jgi:predicted lipoprotein
MQISAMNVKKSMEDRVEKSEFKIKGNAILEKENACVKGFRTLMNKFLVTLAITGAMVFSGCTDEKQNKNDGFDRSAMLDNYATNLIIPAYKNLQSSVNTLTTSANAFLSTPTLETLVDVQLAWENAYVNWQYANAYNFGPAGEEGLTKGLIEEIGTFPVGVAKVENAMNTETYNFKDFNRDARGLLTIEYLLFDLQDNNQVVVDAFQSQSRKKYLTDLIHDTKTRVDAVVEAWSTNYVNSFTTNNGTDVGSSTSLVYNEFIKSFESIKNFKVGLPLGKRPGQIQIEPSKTEAYYSGSSVKMMKTHIHAVVDLWHGRKQDGTDGIGFKEYLEAVEGGSTLVASTEAQLEAILKALQSIPDKPRFSEQLQSNATAIDALHTELQKNTRYFKSDMSSLLGIAITFSSGDGD